MGEEIKLDLTIRHTEEGWEAIISSTLPWSVGVRGNTPQRAILRLALALIAKPSQMPYLQGLFAIDDPVVRRVLGDAENALRKIERQSSGGSCSVEQCQAADAPTE